MSKPMVNVITMGCSKNLIDSERLMYRLKAKGYDLVHNPKVVEGDYAVVNTCGFIGDAKEESIEMILSLVALKEQNKIDKIAVMGCLSERYLADLKKEIPEVDFWYGKFDWTGLVDSLPDLSSQTNPVTTWDRTLTTPSWSAYIKVSEGCNRFCAFCAIPHITGRHKSRPQEEILQEVESLVAKGVKEFNIIAQDLSSYGLDIDGTHKLPELIDRMALIDGVEWIRLHYLYPTDFPYGILEVMNRHQNVCKYLDIALQHISDPVLKAMNRKITGAQTRDLLKTIRESVPGIHIRTTIMTGFPGETEDAYRELVEFVKDQKFERLGGFAYCEEDDTLAASTLKDDIDPKIKEQRLAEIMAIQQEISEEHNKALIGKTVKVLVESHEGIDAVGRTEFDSPEVDQEVIIKGSQATPGTFVNVKITDAGPFELIGKPVISK